MNTTGTKKRTYDGQFRRDAVALLRCGRKAAQLARELGTSHWNLRDWKELYGTGASAVSQPQARMNPAQACQTLGVSRSGYHAHLRKHQRPPRRPLAAANLTHNPVQHGQGVRDLFEERAIVRHQHKPRMLRPQIPQLLVQRDRLL